MADRLAATVYARVVGRARHPFTRGLDVTARHPAIETYRAAEVRADVQTVADCADDVQVGRQLFFTNTEQRRASCAPVGERGERARPGPYDGAHVFS
ncbi:MAG: hypothetical protein OHK0013_15810 [Sandaracinaceae bacterium]